MVLKIRFRQQGRKNRQTFRLVVTDIRNPRDGKYLETVGSYDPHQKEGNFQLNAERLTYWMNHGAELSERAERLVKGVAPGIIKNLKIKQQNKRVKEAAERRKLKKRERVKKSTTTEEPEKKTAKSIKKKAAAK